MLYCCNGVSDKPQGESMKKTVVALSLMGLMVLPAFGQDKEADRVMAAGTVISEIMNVPDDIPQNVNGKTDWVLRVPLVPQGGLHFSGSYGPGGFTCRSGRHLRGPWSAPSMMA